MSDEVIKTKLSRLEDVYCSCDAKEGRTCHIHQRVTELRELITAELAHARQQIKELRLGLQCIADLTRSLPSGVDEEADANNQSPEDMAAHIGGLIWQTATKALKEIP